MNQELEAVGIRLNQKRPDVYFKVKASGGILYTATCNVTACSDRMVKLILQEYKVHNCEIIIREDISVDQLIDVIEGNRVYLRYGNGNENEVRVRVRVKDEDEGNWGIEDSDLGWGYDMEM